MSRKKSPTASDLNPSSYILRRLQAAALVVELAAAALALGCVDNFDAGGMMADEYCGPGEQCLTCDEWATAMFECCEQLADTEWGSWQLCHDANESTPLFYDLYIAPCEERAQLCAEGSEDCDPGWDDDLICTDVGACDSFLECVSGQSY